jgi:large exoprotein involved in heme utilization and adhesion
VRVLLVLFFSRDITTLKSGFGTDTTGSGKAGNITLRADYIELDDTQFNSRTAGSGNAGDIDVFAQTLRLLNGAQLNVSTRTAGDGGSITVNANTIELNGEPTQGKLANKNTGIISSVIPAKQLTNETGDGGNISLTSSSLLIRDGALISTSTSAGQGDGGKIDLQVDRLEVLSGGQVMAITRNQGNAGRITINARDRILLSGSDPLHTQRQAAYIPNQDYSDVEYNIGALSGIFANATSEASGSGGNLRITGGELRIQEGAIVNVGSQGTGNAGDLIMDMTDLYLGQRGSLQAEATVGSQGNLFLNLDRSLVLRQGSTITTNATGTANGGNIAINAPIILGLENSDVIANAIQGRGGNIDIVTQGIIGLEFRNTLTPRIDSTNDLTASSEFNLNGSVQITNVGVDPNSGLVQLSSSLVDPSQKIAANCSSNQGSSFVVTGRGGISPNPSQETFGNFTLPHDRTWQDLRPSSDARQASKIEAAPVLVEATTWRRNLNGKIQLIAEQPMSVRQIVMCDR